METLNFEVNFSEVTDKQNIIRRLVSTLHLPDSPEWKWNWDTFEDYFTNLDPDSEIVRNANPKPGKVNITVKNIEDVKKVSKKDYEILLSILNLATKRNNRGDDIEFIFDIKSK